MSSSGESRQDAERCHVTYGDVIDKAVRKNISICRRAGQDGGLSRVYVSQSSLLHIVFTAAASAQQQQQQNFIIHVEGKSSKPKKLETVLLAHFILYSPFFPSFRILSPILASTSWS